MPTSAEPSVQLVGNLATWPRPSERSSNSKREKERLVYAVIQKQSSGRWRQIIQVGIVTQSHCCSPLFYSSFFLLQILHHQNRFVYIYTMDFVCADVLCSHSFSPLSSDPFSFLSLSLSPQQQQHEQHESLDPSASVRPLNDHLTAHRRSIYNESVHYRRVGSLSRLARAH